MIFKYYYIISYMLHECVLYECKSNKKDLYKHINK